MLFFGPIPPENRKNSTLCLHSFHFYISMMPSNTFIALFFVKICSKRDFQLFGGNPKSQSFNPDPQIIRRLMLFVLIVSHSLLHFKNYFKHYYIIFLFEICQKNLFQPLLAYFDKIRHNPQTPFLGPRPLKFEFFDCLWLVCITYNVTFL